MITCTKCGGALRALSTLHEGFQTKRVRWCVNCRARFKTIEVEMCREAMEDAYKDLDRKTTRADYRRGVRRPLPWRLPT